MRGSSEDYRDLQEVLRIQSERGRSDCAFAAAHPDFNFESLYADVLGPGEIRRAAPILHDVFSLTGRFHREFKQRYLRPRPFEADPRVQTCARRPSDPSYPSGHAVIGIVSSCVLEKMFPAKAALLREQGQRIGSYRVGIGVHYPTDVAAGQKLGQEVCDALLRDSQFRQEMESAK